jgi:hypothetical protein
MWPDVRNIGGEAFAPFFTTSAKSFGVQPASSLVGIASDQYSGVCSYCLLILIIKCKALHKTTQSVGGNTDLLYSSR